jgi:hypothetical protein
MSNCSLYWLERFVRMEGSGQYAAVRIDNIILWLGEALD